LNTKSVNVIELVGDATRIPSIIKTVQNAFQKECSRTLNSQDCIARGCALQAAMLSKYASKNAPVIEDFNQIPIMISYQFANSKVITKELFGVGTTFPSTKSITFENKAGGMQLLVHYHEKFKLLQGLPNQIAQHEILEAQPDKSKHITKY
jgi:heat shock protein 4